MHHYAPAVLNKIDHSLGEFFTHYAPGNFLFNPSARPVNLFLSGNLLQLAGLCCRDFAPIAIDNSHKLGEHRR